MSKISHIHALFFIFCLIFNACQLDQIEVDSWSPEIATPLINATVTIADLIPEKGTTEYDENNLIHLAFRSDSIYVLDPALMQNIIGLNIDTSITLEFLALELVGAGVLDFLGIETPFPDSQEISGDLFQLLNTASIDPFSFEFDEFSNASFNSGELEIGITNNLPISIENAQINITPDSDILWEVGPFQLEAGETYIQSIPLNGVVIDNSNSLQIEIETLELESVDGDVSITPQTGFEFYFNMNNIGFDNITLPLGGDTVDVDLALFEDFDSGLELENPQFTITVDNPFSLSGSINGDLLAHSQYGAQEVLMIDIDIEPNTISSKTYYNNEIGPIIALPPQTLEYEANATLNFNANDIVGNDPLKLGVDIDFPLSVNAANLSLKDTVVFTGIDYDFTQIEHVFLHYNLINEFPLGTEFNLVLRDSVAGLHLDTLEFVAFNDGGNNIINPAIVDLFGEVEEPTLSSGTLILSNSEINNFLNTNQIIIDVTLSSSGFQDENQYVKIYSHHKCLLKAGLETKINLD